MTRIPKALSGILACVLTCVQHAGEAQGHRALPRAGLDTEGVALLGGALPYRPPQNPPQMTASN